jgi:hypothetical protein
MILLSNHKRTEFGKPRENRGPVCASGDCQLCGELVLQALQLQQMSFCRKFPGGTSISHYRPNQGFMEGQFNISAQSLTFEWGI